jgi:elongation factor Ts
VADISATLVKTLREQTGAGMMDCKRALEETSGDLAKAAVRLREKGLAAAAKKAGRATSEGLVTAYIHPGGRVGVLVEVNCETDFVARTDEFTSLCRDVAMQVAASSPRWVRREEVPEADLEGEKAILAAQARNEGKPDRIVEQMVAGRIKKFYADWCLYDQPFVKNPDVTVGEWIQQVVAKVGENIQVRRFTRYGLGEALGEAPAAEAEEAADGR